MDTFTLPFWEDIKNAKTVLLAGAGGGYDIFSGLPLYFKLRGMSKTVHLANLSFSQLYASNGKRHGPALVEVTHKTEGSMRYFPEKHLCDWFKKKWSEEIPIYCFDRVGVRPVTTAYRNLMKRLGGVDAVILVDGGTDSLMRGDEPHLGTPEEDIASLCAVDALEDVRTKLLVCVGFGVDTFHGVCHAYFLEAVADLIRSGGYRGAWSLMREMPEVALYKEATDYVHSIMFNNPSIVSSSVLSAIDGQFGDHHATYRTEGSKMFINPLMSLCWAFRVKDVIERNLYHHLIRETEVYQELSFNINLFRTRNRAQEKPWLELPM
jgi:hypothetical protein